MRFIALALLPSLAVWCPTEGLAQNATQDILITATVSPTCTINNAATGSVATVAITVSAAGAVDTTPKTPVGSPVANVACNSPSDLRLSSLSGGVRTAATGVTGFAGKIDYSASATWNAVTATISTVGASGPVSGSNAPVATAYSGSLSVSVTPIANTEPLLAGSYSDTLRVTLIPH